MSFIPVEYLGVHAVGPEEHCCVLLRWSEKNQVLPIWVSPIAAMELEAHGSGFVPRRPGMHELLADALDNATSGVAEIAITSVHQGLFVATLYLEDGEELDARPSDAMIMAQILELPIHVDADVLAHSALYASPDVLREYLHVSVEDLEGEETADSHGGNSAVGDAQADADFEELMHNLGVSDSDLVGDETDVTKDNDDAGESEDDNGGI